MKRNPFAQFSRTRRRLVIGAAIVSVAAMVAGCSGGGDAAPGDSGAYTPPAADFEAEITYGIWDETQKEAIEANIEGFNEEYPNIKVNVNVTPWGDYWTKLQTQGSSTTLPDLFWMNGPNFQLYASNGLFEPITSVIEGGHIDPANYPEALVNLYTYEDVNYAVPKDFDTIGVWYNKAIFEKAGVAEPQEGWTWEDFHEKAAAITAALGSEGIYGTAATVEGQAGYYNTILQAGGEIISEDGTTTGFGTPEAEAGLQYWADLIADGSSPNIQQLTDTYGLTWFTSGKVAMYQHGSWTRNAIVDSEISADATAIEMPTGERQATIIHGVANVVSASSENKQAAHALQVYLAGEEAQRQQGELGAVIPAFNGTQQAFVDSIPEYNLQIFLDAIDYSYPYPVSENTSAWAALEAEILMDGFAGKRSITEVNEELGTRVQELLDAE
ncbi:ABC transporter substrate-binding protein [Homoserinimonas sp. A447]